MMQKVWLRLCCLLLPLHLQAQDYNTDFEKWHPGLTSTRMAEEPGIPGCYSTMIGDIIATGENLDTDSILTGWSATQFGLTRTNDAHSGQYAAMVHMWYNGAPGVLCLGKTSDPLNVHSKVHFDRKLYGVSGYYKYITDSLGPNDTYRKVTMLHVRTYKKNGTTQALELLHHDSLTFSRTDVYKEFYLPVTYTEPGIRADSISIWFESKGYGSGTTICPLSHFLYLDDIIFRYTPYTLPVKDLRSAGKKKMIIHPNPARGSVRLQNETGYTITAMLLMDITGRIVRSFRAEQLCLDLEGLEQGTYILAIRTQAGNVIEKIIIE